MKINENTKWGEVDKDLEFLDKPKPKLSVMGYNKDDIPGGDIEREYTANGEINPFHGTDDTAHISSSNRTLVYWKDAFEEKVREIVRLESKLAYANATIEDLKEELKEFYNENN